ncbi:MAG: LysM peptidoglycan-binding domain-containing protein [Phycisphaerales bacterium]|nr:LysM peptidoglycan-binding domain-containing protein [Phycisphaerales bacterium]
MGMETRIGIATGLLIVVVASVYFFFNRDRTEGDLLIAGGKKSEPFKLPINLDNKKKTSVQDKKSDRKTKPAAKARPLRKQGLNQRVAAGNAERPHRRTRLNSSAPTRQRAKGNPARGLPQKPKRSSPTTLRSGASQALVDATQNNLSKRNASKTPSPKQAVKTNVKKPIAKKKSAAPASGTNTAKKPQQNPQARRSAPTRPAARPPEVWPKRHRVGSGDTLSDISIKYYSTSLLANHILKANPNIRSPKYLKIDDILVIPSPPAPKAATPAKRPDRTGQMAATHAGGTAAGRKAYRVRKGDTFYSIAQQMLGSSTRWREIYDRNRAVVNNDPKRLKPGMVLTLPG